MTLAILSALADEQRGLIDQLQHPVKVLHAGRVFWRGELHSQNVVLALSRIGKVSAAVTAAALIERFNARQIVFTGVAGGVAAGVQVGMWWLPRSLFSMILMCRPCLRALKCLCMAAPCLIATRA